MPCDVVYMVGRYVRCTHFTFISAVISRRYHLNDSVIRNRFCLSENLQWSIHNRFLHDSIQICIFVYPHNIQLFLLLHSFIKKTTQFHYKIHVGKVKFIARTNLLYNELFIKCGCCCPPVGVCWAYIEVFRYKLLVMLNDWI